VAIAVAQETCDPATGGMSGSGTTFTSSSITVAAGSILVAVACGVNAAAATVTFSDSVNGSTGWTTLKNVANNPLVLSMGYRENMASGTVTVTATYNTTVSQRGIKLLEITGAKTSSSLDGTPAGQFQTGIGTTADAVTSGNLTTANSPALLVGACMNYGNNRNPSTGTGFTSTRVDWSTDVAGCRIEYKAVNAGTQAATYTNPGVGNDNWLTIASAFDEAPAGTSPPPPSSPYPTRQIPVAKQRLTEFAIATASGVFTGTGFAPPERAVVATRRVRPPLTDIAPPLVVVAPSPPAPEVLRALPPRLRPPAAQAVQMAPFPGPVPVVGLRLWLRSDLGVTLSGPNVVAWADQSGNDNHTVNSGTVPFVPVSVNGYPGVTTSGAAGMVGTTDPLIAGSPRSIFVVSKSATSAGGMALALRTTTIGNLYALTGTGSGYGAGVVYYNTDATGPMTVSSPGDLTGRTCISEWTVTGGGGAAPTYKLNNVTPGVLGAGSEKTETGASGFGVGVTGIGPFNTLGSVGDICEVLVYDSVLSLGDETAVYAYLAARYFPAAQPQLDAPVRQTRPLRFVTTLDPLPPVAAAAPAPPAPEMPRALPRHGASALAQQSTQSLPPATRSAPVDNQPVRRLIRSLVNVVREAIGLAPLLPPPPAELKLKPPLWAVFDEVSLTVEPDAVALSATADEVTLSVEADT